MTDRRSGPPLFDLMRERDDDHDARQPTPQPAPSPVAPRPPSQPGEQSQSGPPVPTKQTAWDTSGGVSRAERSAAAMLDEEVQTDSGVRLSTPTTYLCIAIVFALIIGAWAFGYQRGLAAGKAEIEHYVQDQPVVRPAQGSNPVTPGEQTDLPTLDPGGNSASNSTRNTTNQPSSPTAGGARVMSPSGYLDSDPRIAANNYLVLATLSTEQAADAISFMYSHGVRVIGVPSVDSRGSSANNPSRYTLYSLGVAIPGNRWSAMSAQRTEHQQLVADLGARWQREQRGVSDFSRTNWEKYEP
jgi:hypothetical protein